MTFEEWWDEQEQKKNLFYYSSDMFGPVTIISDYLNSGCEGENDDRNYSLAKIVWNDAIESVTRSVSV